MGATDPGWKDEGVGVVGVSATVVLMLNGDEKNKRIDKGYKKVGAVGHSERAGCGYRWWWRW